MLKNQLELLLATELLEWLAEPGSGQHPSVTTASTSHFLAVADDSREARHASSSPFLLTLISSVQRVANHSSLQAFIQTHE